MIINSIYRIIFELQLTAFVFKNKGKGADENIYKIIFSIHTNRVASV
jgi:hypothetical protein